MKVTEICFTHRYNLWQGNKTGKDQAREEAHWEDWGSTKCRTSLFSPCGVRKDYLPGMMCENKHDVLPTREVHLSLGVQFFIRVSLRRYDWWIDCTCGWLQFPNWYHVTPNPHPKLFVLLVWPVPTLKYGHVPTWITLLNCLVWSKITR